MLGFYLAQESPPFIRMLMHTTEDYKNVITDHLINRKHQHSTGLKNIKQFYAMYKVSKFT